MKTLFFTAIAISLSASTAFANPPASPGAGGRAVAGLAQGGTQGVSTYVHNLRSQGYRFSRLRQHYDDQANGDPDDPPDDNGR
ncbi:hypothetical protein PGB28_00630 [Primorskyibacter aestuariivivens]|uniref:hypothetical protein n=1 Tax=Primorskyibacter aestuariivivens TaxID=1888912 RepID=UPI00230096B2|nr:hypothetical protein [Primorskyibacter aestuariivivens]MDA7426943.1 hypothetical protein [Primorskyibacter aestuariivivens]